MDAKSFNIGNSELITQVNRTLVLQAVRALEPTYRAEVSRRTHLKPATVTGIVSDLIDENLLSEVPGETQSPTPSGGRPPMMLEVNGDAMRMLAVDLEADIVRVALVDLKMTILEYAEGEIDRFGNPESVIEEIAKLSEPFLSMPAGKQLSGIGMSLPGLIDKEEGILISSTNMPHWHNVPICDLVAQRIGYVPQVGRAVHLAALYEDWMDLSDRRSTKLLLLLRTGIGMSLVRQGELYSGAGGFDGEIGHTTIDLGGQECECGNRGCLETYVSASAIVSRAEKMIGEGRAQALSAAVQNGKSLRPELVYQLAKRGDADCSEIVRDVGRYIGIAAANLANIFGPDTLILCGSIDTADALLLDAVKEQIMERALQPIRRHLTVQLATAKEKSALLGAAVLVARKKFELPRL